MPAKPKTIDEYLAALGDEQRAALEKLRKTIKAAAPDAEECISYGLCAFRAGGMLVGFGAAAKHCAFYLMSGSTVGAHQELLKKYDTSKGAIRFQPDKRSRSCGNWSNCDWRRMRPSTAAATNTGEIKPGVVCPVGAARTGADRR